MSSAEIVARRNLHLKGLQRIHPDVLEIIDDIPHVALYRYVLETGKWTRMDIEGSAYISRNSQPPLYSLIIMNKKGADDLILHILNNVEKVKLQDQYLMIKCTHENETKIFGIWIHDEETRKKSKEALERILKSASEPTSNNLIQKLSNLKIGVVHPNADAAKKKTEDTIPVSASASRPEEKLSLDQNLKSVQLLSLLKKPTPTVPVVAQAKLPPQPEVGPENGSTSTVVTSSPSNQKAEKLLALIKPSGPVESTPPKAELLTDGDIARKISIKPPVAPNEPMKSERMVAAGDTSQPSQKTGGGGRALLALLKDIPPTGKNVPSSQLAPISSAPSQSVSSTPSDQSSVQKKTITPPIPTKKPLLISPSDLEI